MQSTTCIQDFRTTNYMQSENYYSHQMMDNSYGLMDVNTGLSCERVYHGQILPVMGGRGWGRDTDGELMQRCHRRPELDHHQRMAFKIQPNAVARRNERERNRVRHINTTFSTLRQHLPSGTKSKKMSKVETLRSAIRYINHLRQILRVQEGESAESTGLPSESSGSPPCSPCSTDATHSDSEDLPTSTDKEASSQMNVSSPVPSTVSEKLDSSHSEDELVPEVREDLMDLTEWFH